jgi:2-iminobutanoate/2-iminopropanoate deaminase
VKIKKAVFPPGKEGTSGPYSPGLTVGDLVFVSGQGPIGRKPTDIVGTTIAEQTEATLRNVEHILREAGCTMNDCVKSTVHLRDMADFDAMNAVYKCFFTEPFPTRTTVQSGLWGGILVEIDVIAVRGAGDRRSAFGDGGTRE